MNTVIKFKPLVYNLAIPLVAGGVSSYLAGDTAEAYKSLVLPGFAPPGWILNGVCTVLYVIIGYAAYLAFTNHRADMNTKGRAAAIYFVQLFLNFIWGPLFFRFGLLTLAGCLVAAMIILTIVTIVRFYVIDKSAGVLMMPYLVWLIFTMVLNFSIAALN